MKKILIPVLVLFSVQLFAQTGMSILAKFPSLPNSTCIADTTEMNIYHKQLRKVTRELDSLCELRKKELEERIKKLKPDIEKNIAKDYGLSDSDVQKLKNKKISDKEKKALMEKMLQEKTQISLGEIEQLKKMKKEKNKEGIQNWADAYTTQKMAEMTTGDSTKTPEQIEMEKNLEKNAKLNNLMKEQKIIVDRIAAVDKRITNKMIEFNIEDSTQTYILNKNVKPLEKMLMEDYPTKEQQRVIYEKIALHHLNYCNKISPMYMDIIRDLRVSTEPILPLYDKLEILNAEINAKTMGIKEWPTSPGLMQLDAVSSLAHAIADIYKYTIVIPNQLQ